MQSCGILFGYFLALLSPHPSPYIRDAPELLIVEYLALPHYARHQANFSYITPEPERRRPGQRYCHMIAFHIPYRPHSTPPLQPRPSNVKYCRACNLRIVCIAICVLFASPPISRPPPPDISIYIFSTHESRAHARPFRSKGNIF